MSSELQKDAPVLIVGGGPVGMTMALCLADRRKEAGPKARFVWRAILRIPLCLF